MAVGMNLISSEQLLRKTLGIKQCGSRSKLCWTALLRAGNSSMLFALVYCGSAVHCLLRSFVLEGIFCPRSLLCGCGDESHYHSYLGKPGVYKPV